MKNLLILLIAAFTFNVSASESCSVSSSQVEEQTEIKTDVPKFLEGATIIVRLKDGTETSVPAEKFKVVPRIQQYIVTKTKDVKVCTADERHRISVLGGKGTKDGLDRDNSQAPNKVTVENDVGAVLGAQYQYKTGIKILDMPLSIGVQGQSNKTGSVLIGIDF